MNPDGRRVTIEHGNPCGCLVDGRAIYVRLPCRVVGHRVTKKRIGQLLHDLVRKVRS